MDDVLKNNTKRLTFNVRFPLIKKKNSTISSEYTPLSNKIMD